MFALAVDGTLTQAVDSEDDGPIVAAFCEFEADGLLGGICKCWPKTSMAGNLRNHKNFDL